MKNPEQIAQATLDAHAIRPDWRRSGEQILGLIAEAIEADRAQRADPLARVRAVLDAEIGWETPAVLKDRIEWALSGKEQS